MSAPSPPLPSASPHPSLRHNWEDWLPYLENEHIPEAAKERFIEAVWTMVLAFVDLGWDVTPDSPSQETCGQVLDLRAALAAAVLNSTNTETTDQKWNAPENLAAPNEELSKTSQY